MARYRKLRVLRYRRLQELRRRRRSSDKQVVLRFLFGTLGVAGLLVWLMG